LDCGDSQPQLNFTVSPLNGIALPASPEQGFVIANLGYEA
jgi:hypothetical protein